MGVLADIFIGTADEADQYESLASSSKASEQLQTLQLTGMSDIEFGILWALLERQEWNVERHLLEELNFDDDCSLFQFQPELLQLLANISDVDSIAKQWANTEELKESHWRYEATLQLVKDLNRLAKLAIGNNKGLYLWVSL